MKSFGLLKTNVLLTANIKLIINSKNDLYLESINSDAFLSLSKLKKFRYNTNLTYGKNLSIFFEKIPSEIIFNIKKDNLYLMSDKYNNQNENLYEYGARSILNNKDYEEKFEYFAPLHIDKNIPTNFFIFRIDDAEYVELSKVNFKEDILNKLKVVSNFSLDSGNIHNFLKKSFIDNQSLSDTQIEINFNDLEFSYWYGIDINSGVYTHKSFMFSNYMKEEREIYELEKFTTYNYKNLGLVYPNIINFSFLFNDYPSTPEFKKEWSLNKYFGFYIDQMVISDTITTYKGKELKNDVVIESGNILKSLNDGYPFMEEWDETIPFYIEYKGIFYLVSKKTERNKIDVTKVNKGNFFKEELAYIAEDTYYIISDIDLEGMEDDLNKKTVVIQTDGSILNLDNTNYELDTSSADMWVINIDGNFYSLTNIDGVLKINSDYAFEFNDFYYRIKSAGKWNKIEFNINFNNKPLSYNIFKLKITDIKSFDNRIVNTDLSRYEYEIDNEISNSEEPKLFMDNFNDMSYPRSIENFRYKSKDVFLPVSSEYTANLETFKTNNNNLSDIWQPNSDYCRWGYKNSLSMYDYPYTLNNSFILEKYNRSIFLENNIPVRTDRNLDYFYTLNINKGAYDFDSLDINKESFELNTYLSNETDYFSDFFEGAEVLNGKLKKYKKYAFINKENTETNNVLFRGIKFNLYKVLEKNSSKLSYTNLFEDYKFSILLTKKKDSLLSWDILKEWKVNKEYNENHKVVFNDIIYVSLENTIQTNPIVIINDVEIKASPFNLPQWIPYNQKTILWTPSSSVIYNNNDIVYNTKNYYICVDQNSNIDFWNPYNVYQIDSVVLFKGRYYKSIINNNIFSPDQGLEQITNNKSENIGRYWSVEREILNPKWKSINIWSSDRRYNINDVVFYNDIVYIANNDVDMNQSPLNSSSWNKVYSLIPNNQTVYQPNYNSIIFHNEHFYLINNNPNNELLDNGIEIYINKKWNNILILLNISDNTLPVIENEKRELFYDLLYTKLTAINFMNSINNWDLRGGWVNELTYYIIDKDSNIAEYKKSNSNNIEYFIQTIYPDELKLNPFEIQKRKSNLSPNLNIKNKLISNNIENVNQIEYYSNIPLSYEINSPISSDQDLEPTILFRHSGDYSPIFMDINLFNNNNFKFNIDLDDFGILKEKKIIKVNINGSILKLRNDLNFISIYPMIDEFGISFIDWFIFKSTYSDIYLYSINKI